jgi:hypothetical protein
MKKTFQFALTCALFGTLSFAAESTCLTLGNTIKESAAAKPAEVVELVSKQVAASPGCACEIVKAAIEGSSADAATVAAIVEAAALSAPDQLRLVSQCAVAMAPDAVTKVQAVLAKLDPNAGESANVSAKSGQAAAKPVAALGNPLDFPGGLPPFEQGGPSGSGSPGGPGGPGIPGMEFPVFPPTIIIPPLVTNPNPPQGGGI